MNDNRYKGLSAGIFLIGLGLIFMLRIGIWPWILAVIGLAGLPAALATQRGWLAYQGAFWMIGLALLFATGHIWPGILILVGLSVLLGGMAHGAQRATSDRAKPSGEGAAAHPSEAEPFDVDEPLFQDPGEEQERRSSHDTRQL
jgi:hypothetical protein